MPKGPVRRGQLIAPFGVGAMVVVRDGTSLISGGLDHWYEREGEGEKVDVEEYKIEEWRLQRRLGVDHFRQPPDYRDSNQAEEVPNTGLTVPFLRFPQWHFCPERTCRQLRPVPLTERSRVKCPACERSKRTRYLVQVPFVAMCDNGHIQDFPWREWAHKNANPTCNQPIRLRATGGASLGAQMVECDCGAKRSLASITEAPNRDDSFLSRELEPGGRWYSCRGMRPWLGIEDEGEECDRPVRGTLRSASNVYSAQMKSAIYLPRGSSAAPSELIEMLQNPPFSSPISLLVDAGAEVKPLQLRKNYSEQLRPYTDDQVQEALRIIISGDDEEDDDDRRVEGDDIETAFRRAEFKVLKTERDESQLTIRGTNVGDYDDIISRHFSRLMLVPKLRETRVLAGFSRVLTGNEQDLEDRRKSMLWRRVPEGTSSWLPAYIVFGEGIMLEFGEERLREWESRDSVVRRVDALANNYLGVQQAKGLRQRDITPRFVLLHTFSHLLMNRLTFECGYSSAALRERLFVSSNRSAPMAGVLIYTAAGDAEGTMGGLVRMGKRGNLEPVIAKALDEAKWCSADPVCMEMGSSGGQGPDSCNLAACHSCALVPETACEEFNRFLDRALVIGDPSATGTGYFT